MKVKHSMNVHLKIYLNLLLTLCAIPIAFADDLRVVEVRRNIPLADNDNTMSSIEPSRRCLFATTTGVNVPARSRGTSISIGPAFVNTVFGRVPLR